MNDLETKRGIENSLKSFADKPMVDAATALFESLGYKSQKRITLKPNTAKTFTENFAKDKPLNPGHALLADWQSVDFLFQLTDEEVHAAAAGNQQFLFEAHGRWNGAEINSFLFLAITLAKANYTRTELSGITRAVNRLFPMPAMLLFRHGDTLTLAVINRRLHKRDESKDVLEKVTLIKDIRFANPHRAHVEILADLSFDALHDKHGFSNFVALQAAWQKALDSSELNKRFFQEIANWYFWALGHVTFPKPKDIRDTDAYKAQSVIRLITRLIFCWFVKEKGLIPNTLFDERKLVEILHGFTPAKTADKESVFYKAILQNLFFATLNQEMNTPDKPDSRKFRGRTRQKGGRDPHHMIHNVYRYEDAFQNPAQALQLFATIPFLNGGLFECLDKQLDTDGATEGIRIDGFSDHPKNPLCVPDFLFFGAEREADLSENYGDNRFKKVKVRGLIHTFDHYKFTVTENTPIEEEIALDPELSGRVFENLLAAYNPETGATARKQTGSFFTPREIVNYMVDEALIAYLKTKLEAAVPTAKDVEARLRHLFAYNDEPHQFTPQEVDALIAAIDSLKSLDPAVGSGAFPMGILHKLVFILGKLDKDNVKWRERQRQRAIAETEEAFKVGDKDERMRRLEDINEVFESNASDYGRKLYLIENCIYGVDIQPIAVQIAKMRFFISLIVDQKIDDKQPNRGVRPLPNLETKFVAANTLIGIEKPSQQMLRNPQIDSKDKELKEVRDNHFSARTPHTKAKWRDADAILRAEISELLKADGFPRETTEKLANWNPYDQNASADFFDAEWMFGIVGGFDLCVGNPPYGAEIPPDQLQQIRLIIKDTNNSNSAALFIDIAKNKLIDAKGVVTFIVPKSLLYSEVWQSLAFKLSPNTLSLVDVETAFENVLLEQVVFVFTNGVTHQNYIGQKFLADSFVRRTTFSSKVVQLFEAWPCDVTEEEMAIGMKIRNSGVLLEKISHTTRGLPIQRLLRDNGKVQVIGGKNLKRFGLNGVKGWVSESALSDNDKKVSWLRKPKILSQNIVAHIQNPKPHIMIVAVPDLRGDVLSVDTVVNTVLTDERFDVRFVTALFNCTLVNWYVYKFVFCSAIRTMHFDNYYIGKIPVSKSIVDEPAKQKPIVALVDRILAAKQKNPAADTSALEREIDQQVYALYGLTPEEIKIVEDGNQ